MFEGPNSRHSRFVGTRHAAPLRGKTFRLLALAAFLLAGFMAAVQGAPSAAAEASIDEGVRRIAVKLQCPVCQGTSVADSPSPVAQDMREVIRAKLEAGEADAAILRYFVERYGPGVLREPPKSGVYSAVWWVPGVAVLLGAAAVYSLVRRRRASPVPVDRSVTADGTRTYPLSESERGPGGEVLPSDRDAEAYRSRLKELERGDR